MKTEWIRRWDYTIAPNPTLPGVWRRKEGGFVVRGRTTDPRTGKVREVLRALPESSAADARAWLVRELEAIRKGAVREAPAKTRFADFAVSLLERKIKANDIKSAKGREKWGYILEHHLIPAFGAVYIDKLQYCDFEDWRASVGERITAGDYSPHTANDWLAVLRVIMKAATKEFRLGLNPLDDVEDFDTSDYETYTEEEPNALTVEEVPRFLGAVREFWPQHFAMVCLGFATGLRPSSLRPLRRCGETPDVLWDEGVLLVRRSHTVGEEVMNKTKTGNRQRIPLPKAVMDVLDWHVEFQLPDGAPDNELLFPSETGGFRSRSCLDKPFADVTTRIGLKKRITPRAMRRTFQDLCRAAEVRDVVTRAVSGHATESMQHHYSTVAATEIHDGLARVVSLAGFRTLVPADVGKQAGKTGGDGGGEALNNKKAG